MSRPGLGDLHEYSPAGFESDRGLHGNQAHCRPAVPCQDHLVPDSARRTKLSQLSFGIRH